jgi:hypothetical protein
MSSNNSDKEMNANPLNRYPTTISITPEQYERLFFQPSAPRGDASKRFGEETRISMSMNH